MSQTFCKEAISPSISSKVMHTGGSRRITLALLPDGATRWDDLPPATAPEATPAIRDTLSLARQQWVFYDTALQRLDRRARTPQHALQCEAAGVVTAMLAGAARVLAGRQAELQGTVSFMFQPVPQGALPTLMAATDPAAKPGGYYGPQGFMEVRGLPGEASAPGRSLDVAVARKLWDVSEELSGVRFPERAAAA